MSIETPLAPTASESTANMASEKVSLKGDKKHKSSHGENKRKRDTKEDGHKSKSKKHKSDKPAANTEAAPGPSNPSHENSAFQIQTYSLYLPLAPVSQKFPLEGLCAEHLSPLVLTYYPPFAAVILAYTNPRFSERAFGNDGTNGALLKNTDEYAVSWAWVTAEFLLFKTDKGTELEGYVNFQNEGHLGLVCWNMFNASIDRSRLPADWKWVSVGELEVEEGAEGNYAEDGAGYFINGEGTKIEGIVKFKVKDIETGNDGERPFLNIAGTMLETHAETTLAESEKVAAASNTKGPAARRIWPSKAPGFTSLGASKDPDGMDVDSGKKKHRQRY